MPSHAAPPPADPQALTAALHYLRPDIADDELARIRFAYAGHPEAEHAALAALLWRVATANLRHVAAAYPAHEPEIDHAVVGIASTFDGAQHRAPLDRVALLSYEVSYVARGVETAARVLDKLGGDGAAPEGPGQGDALVDAAAMALGAAAHVLSLSHRERLTPDEPVDEGSEDAPDRVMVTAAQFLSASQNALVAWGYPRGYVRMIHDPNCTDEGCGHDRDR